MRKIFKLRQLPYRTLNWNFNWKFLNSMYISSGSKGFRPLESKMILVHIPALCIKRIKNSFIMKEICQSSRGLMEIYFLPLFSAERWSYGIRQILWVSPLVYPPRISLTRYRKQFMKKEDKVHIFSFDIKALGI